MLCYRVKFSRYNFYQIRPFDTLILKDKKQAFWPDLKLSESLTLLNALTFKQPLTVQNQKQLRARVSMPSQIPLPSLG